MINLISNCETSFYSNIKHAGHHQRPLTTNHSTHLHHLHILTEHILERRPRQLFPPPPATQTFPGNVWSRRCHDHLQGLHDLSFQIKRRNAGGFRERSMDVWRKNHHLAAMTPSFLLWQEQDLNSSSMDPHPWSALSLVVQARLKPNSKYGRQIHQVEVCSGMRRD